MLFDCEALTPRKEGEGREKETRPMKIEILAKQIKIMEHEYIFFEGAKEEEGGYSGICLETCEEGEE